MIRQRLLIFVIAVFMLHGCGQTGDLYLPDEDQVEVSDEEKESQQD
ncbi:MAG: lipoprotein [Gammaproteobacteria bacterium]|nr:lipoprotein [Gammaproteobacteria bacterium]NNF66713.1 lipoprotein [Gammaproteobacteria bacterium]